MSENQSDPRGGDVVDAYLLAGEEAEMPPYRWTEDNMLQTDPGGFEPVSAEVLEDTDADAEIWGGSSPDPQGMAAALSRARRVVAIQDAPELRAALSPADVQADLEAERATRDGERDLSRRVSEIRQGQRREEIEHTARLAGWERKRTEAEAETEFELRRVSNPVTQLTTLRKARSWAPAVALVPAVFAVLAGAYNVGAGLTGISPGTAWINWLIEPLVTVPIVAILIAQIAGAVPAVAEAANPWASLRENSYARIEAQLFVVAAGLNVGVHLIGTGADRAMAAVWLVVPFGLAVSMYLAPKLRADLTARFVSASQTVHTAENTAGENSGSAGSGQRGKKLGESAESPGENPGAETIPEPGQRSKEQARAEFVRAVAAGEIDPENQYVNEIAKRLGTRWGNAKEFIAQWSAERR